MSINELTNVSGDWDVDELDEGELRYRRQYREALRYAIAKGVEDGIKRSGIDRNANLLSERDKARLRLDRDLTNLYGAGNRKAKMNWTKRWVIKALGSLLGFIFISGVSGVIPYLLLSNGEMTISPPFAVFVTEVCSVIALWGLFQAVKAWGESKDAWDSYQRYKNPGFLFVGLRGKPGQRGKR